MCQISVNNKVEIGDNVLFASRVFITDTDHRFDIIDQSIMDQNWVGEENVTRYTTVIEDDSWFGIGSVVMKGVRVGKHSVVGANAVVTKDLAPYSVAVGIPARVVKYYDFEEKKWVKKHE